MEHLPDCQHHGWRRIRGDGSHDTADVGRKLAQDMACRICRHTTYHGHQRTLAAMSLLVGQQGIYLSVAKAGLVKTQVRADVFRKENVLVSVFQLVPLPIAADGFLVLLAQDLTVQYVTDCQCGNAYRGGLNLRLKKSDEHRVQTRAVKPGQIPSVAEYLAA